MQNLRLGHGHAAYGESLVAAADGHVLGLQRIYPPAMVKSRW
jgi:hypothetical protein